MKVKDRKPESGADLYRKLQRENHELADCNGRLLDQVGAATKQVIELKKENAELKTDKQYWEQKSNRLTTEWGKTLDQLAQAKVIIEHQKELLDSVLQGVDRTEMSAFAKQTFKEAEQFLKEI